MPLYEMTIILKTLPRHESISALRRAADLIWKNNGVLKKIDYLGYKKLPFSGAIKADHSKHGDGDYFLYHISMPQLKIGAILPELRLDTDFVRATYFDVGDTDLPDDYECTLEEELQTPFYRKSVQPLIGSKNVRADVRNFFTFKKKGYQKTIV